MITWKASSQVGVVVAGGSQAVAAGIQLLEQGRNAADAATATLFATKWPVPVFDFTAKHISYLGQSGFTAGQFVTVLRLIKNGTIDTSSLITHRFTPEDYEEAFETSKKRLGETIKVIFEL